MFVVCVQLTLIFLMCLYQQLAHTVPLGELDKSPRFLWVDAASGQNLNLARWSVAWISVSICPLGQTPLYSEQPEQLYKLVLFIRPSKRDVLLPWTLYLFVFFQPPPPLPWFPWLC